VLVVLAICLGVGLLAIKFAGKTLEPPTECLAGPSGQPVGLTVGQAGIAATIAGVASHRNMPTRAVAIAYATALQESKLANLHYGTLDSVGVFQQRPSEGWGTAQQIEHPVYATERFFAALVQVPRYRRLPIYQAAQDVQRSADGSAYGQYAGVGTVLARAFTGTQPHAVWCSYGSPVGKPRLAAARTALEDAFGKLGAGLTADPAARVDVTGTRQGWAVAAWLVSHAASYGISDVRYAGQVWLATSSTGQWRPEPAAARRPATTTTVVFG
jgi:hypothetical protein